MIYWAAFVSVLISIESVLAGTCLCLLFPAHPSAVSKDFFTTYQHAVVSKQDVLFLRLFIIVGVVSFVLLMRFLSSSNLQKVTSFKYFTVVQAAIVSTQTFFLFKYAVYHYPLWLNGFYLTFIVSLALKIFFPELLKILKSLNKRIKDKAPIPNLSVWLVGVGTVMIPLIIWVPDVEGAVARMFAGEQFHHIDWLLMSPGWAHISGNILGVDTISRYGIGVPILVSEIAKHLLGRFDYVTAVIVMMMVSVVYYWIWFYALRLILKDTAWAFIALFLGLRLQFFHMETFPFIFTYPQVTPLRFFFDSLFFVFLILHTQSGRMMWLYMASAVSGFFVFYITGEGAYSVATFYAFLIMREMYVGLNPGTLMKRLNTTQVLLLLGIPWIVLGLCLWLAVGHSIFTGIFWNNQLEFIKFFGEGSQASLMINNLTSPYIDRASIAFILPVVYLFVLVIFIGQYMQKTIKADGLIMAGACVFLLISYHYHATLSNNMPSYLRNGIVIAMLAIFVIKEMTKDLVQYHQRLYKIGCGILVLVMLVTTHQFLLHPNIFNLARNPMIQPVVSQVPFSRNSYFSHLFISYPDAFKLPVNGLGQKEEMLVTESDFTDDNGLKAFYRRESDYSKDAALIQSLTAPNAPVPLVSSFENLILMQAKRRPFFYSYCLVNSQPRRMRKFPTTVLYTKENLKREISRIEDLKPPYIFVEKTYLVYPIPQAYLYDNEDLVALLTYIFNHYEPYKGGEFLVALKRK